MIYFIFEKITLMSEFIKILQARTLSFHTGQPLWKYNISDFEFEQLKVRFQNVERASQLDPRTCALYYAEWWKRKYIGGYPSKLEIYESIGGKQLCFDDEEFFKLAKQGGNYLNFKWIRIQNTLYLKTLLLQGGLPVNHIKNNKGKYRDFLVKIIHLNPNTIEDFSSDYEVISLLPKSSQNDIIYSSCLEIVRAVLDNDESMLSSFQHNKDLVDIANDLITERDKVVRKGNSLRFRWFYDRNKKTFFLNTSLNLKLNKTDLQYLLNDNVNDSISEYRLFVDSSLIAKLVKRNADTFKVIQVTNTIKFDGKLDPEIYFIDTLDKTYTANHLLYHKLNLEIPSLWNSSGDAIYHLDKSRHTRNNSAFVLCESSYFWQGDVDVEEKLIINDDDYYFVKFKHQLHVKKDNENGFKFKTNAQNMFEWTILSDRPKWILKSNLEIVRNQLRLFVCDKNGERISNPIIQWKPTHRSEWNSINSPLSKGVLDIKISLNEIEEFDRVFNIADLDLNVISKHHHFVFRNSEPFTTEIYPSALYDFEIENFVIRFNIIEHSSFPTSVKTRFSIQRQSAGLIAEIASPFQGLCIVDQNNQKVDDKVLYLDNIRGWRLVSNLHEKEFEISFKNHKNDQIIINKAIDRKIIPLIEFHDTLKSLFQLYNVIDEENYIEIMISEILTNSKTKKIKSYQIKQFSKTVVWKVNEHNKIQFIDDDINFADSVFALPLECELEEIDKIELSKEQDSFSLQKSNIEKFILFSVKNSFPKIKPVFISVNPENKFTTDDDRNARMLDFASQLLEQDFPGIIWNKLWIYYILCKENDLPFATFDIIKSITTSSELAAKAFVFLSEKFDNGQFAFSGNDFAELENDLGFSFHWVKLEHWHNHLHMSEAIATMLGHHFPELKVCLLQNRSKRDFVFLAELNKARERLGNRVLSQLPKYNLLTDRNSYIKPIPHQHWNDEVNILVIAPLAVASSIKKDNAGLWHTNGDSYRRMIKYVENIDKKWYEDSLIFYLN